MVHRAGSRHSGGFQSRHQLKVRLRELLGAWPASRPHPCFADPGLKIGGERILLVLLLAGCKRDERCPTPLRRLHPLVSVEPSFHASRSLRWPADARRNMKSAAPVCDPRGLARSNSWTLRECRCQQTNVPPL